MLLSKFSRGRQGFMFQKYRCLAVWLECEVHTWEAQTGQTHFLWMRAERFQSLAWIYQLWLNIWQPYPIRDAKCCKPKSCSSSLSHPCVSCTGSVHGWIETGLLTLKYLPDSGPAPSPVFLQSGSSWQGSLCICSSGFLFQCFYATHYKSVPPVDIPLPIWQ